MGKNKHLQDLLNKYLSNSCTNEAYEELVNVLTRAENEPHVKQMLSEVSGKILEVNHDETSENDSQQDWFEEIYTQARIRETGASGKSKVVIPEKVPATGSKQFTPQWINVAAILAVSLFLSIAYHIFQAEMTSESYQITTHQRVAAPGEKIRFILSDGTQVHLNSGSHIEFPDSFDENSRRSEARRVGYYER